MSLPKPSVSCAFCEYFDGGGQARIARARLGLLIIQGDCHNRQSPRFTTASDDACAEFVPESEECPAT